MGDDKLVLIGTNRWENDFTAFGMEILWILQEEIRSCVPGGDGEIFVRATEHF
jgi:hypothetical protein